MPFLDIFSNTDKKIVKKKILVDNREKNSLVPSELIRLGLDIEFTQLSVGDYIINNVAIERKTVKDLKSSIINKRIFSQIKDLKQFDLNLIIIEGINNEDLYSGIIHENAIRGFILSTAIHQQMPLIFSRDEKDTAKYLAILANNKSKSEFSLRPKKVFKSKEERLQFILEGFPNIGPVKAKALLKRFKSIKEIINAGEEDLIPILGKKTNEFMALTISFAQDDLDLQNNQS
jgi:ERCC4-type nuclease